MAKVMVVDHEKGSRWTVSTLLKRKGYAVTEAENGVQALSVLSSDLPDAILLDLVMPSPDSMNTLKELKKQKPTIPVIVFTGDANRSSAAEAMKLGAFEHFSKPVDGRELVKSLSRAVALSKIEQGDSPLGPRAREEGFPAQPMGASLEVAKIREQIKMVAGTNFSVLIEGETGTGKELVAHAVHQCSPRKDGPFIALDCGALPETLFESELFGYEKGSFTGAYSRRRGYFELADGGTLFLDEVANLSPGAQAKLLRVLEGKKIRRLGAKEMIEVDARLIVASNRLLDEEVKRREFREDLYHRLREFIIWIAPLRERKEDILFLARTFLEQTQRELDKRVQGFTDEAIELLLSYSWPGNVRELKNVIKRATLLSTGTVEPQHLCVGRLTPSHVPLNTELAASIRRGLSLREIKERAAAEVEKQAIQEALKLTGGNKSRTAAILKTHYKNLHEKIKRYGI